ncbi:hypothetical protein [Streptomyces sp. TLI_171]|uniref:hypothetical protein n=1 Tax=Streptomyces sp. TLI_171 TaxID=1938859 RepID=UPI000C61D816|nr:hypothetical protein [Streptomyces sp. TLI_171]RKE23000.1 hypothetical protein BX266_6456 [Streptomyces sp. TLI_171]
MDRLSEITFLLPNSAGSHSFLDVLHSMFADVAYADFTVGAADRLGDRLTLTPPQPVDARPVTIFQLADVRAPEVAFDARHSIGVRGGADASEASTSALVEMADLARRIAGHVRRVDHTGVNVPACATSPEQWRDLTTALASTSTMYRYPTGEDWPFVLPSASDEFLSGISDFVVGREPRFELVYDQWVTRTQWQFALWTDLTRAELEQMFPEPEGMTFPDLEEVFRVVPVVSPWPGLGIRFDLCYRIENGPSDWETGEWLVAEGGRIR